MSFEERLKSEIDYRAKVIHECYKGLEKELPHYATNKEHRGHILQAATMMAQDIMNMHRNDVRRAYGLNAGAVLPKSNRYAHIS